MNVPSETCRALSAYWALITTQTLSGICTYDPSLKRLEKWSVLCNARASASLILLATTFTRDRTNQKKSTVAINGQELPSLRFPISIVSKIVSASLWVTTYFSTYPPPLCHRRNVASISLFYLYFNG